MAMLVGVVGCKTETAPSRAAESEDVLYEIAPVSVQGTVGQEVELPIVIQARPGYKVNKDFPWRFVLESTPSLTAVTGELTATDVDLQELKAVIPARVKVAQSGEHTGEVTANFSICNDDVCKFYRNEKISYRVTAP
jgi:hypothetical protein